LVKQAFSKAAAELNGTGGSKTQSIMARISVTNWTRRRAELHHGVRITAAGVFSFALAQMLGLPQGYWAVFTAVLVVQGSVGGSWKASVDRLVGTLLGAAYGALIATLVPHNDALMTGVALAISLTPLALLAAFYPSYRVAPITAIIILIGSAGANEGPFLAAGLRTIEVSLGGLVGMGVSLFLLPARAHALLGEAAKTVLDRLAQLLADLMAGFVAPCDAKAILARNDEVRRALGALENISDEAARERRNYLSDDSDPEPVTRTLRRVRHDLVLIGRLAAEPLPAELRTRLAPVLAEFASIATEFLRGMGRAFATRDPPPSLDGLSAAMARLFGEIQAIKGEERLIALRFALEQLERNLKDLTRRAQEFSRVRGPAFEESEP
jgi:uncharacterized membrane protein YccC